MHTHTYALSRISVTPIVIYLSQGPPSAVKRESSSSSAETSYDILLQQQQLFLQCQLELKQKVGLSSFFIIGFTHSQFIFLYFKVQHILSLLLYGFMKYFKNNYIQYT